MPPIPPTKKERLSDLTRAFDSSQQTFLEEVVNGGDRACALVACAYLDRALEDLVESHIDVVLSDDEHRNLLSGSASVIGSLSAKINVAYAFGFITDAERDDLNCVRRIRNVFAHSAQVIPFDHPLVFKECAGLNTGVVEGFFDQKDDPRRRYTVACFVLGGALQQRALKVTQASIRRGTRKLKAAHQELADLNAKRAELILSRERLKRRFERIELGQEPDPE